MPPRADQSRRSFHRSEFETRAKKADYRYPIPFRLAATDGRESPTTYASEIGRIRDLVEGLPVAPFIGGSAEDRMCTVRAAKIVPQIVVHPQIFPIARSSREHYARVAV